MDAIKVKCKRCEKEWDSERLVLDPYYGMMVCPSCVQERVKPQIKPKQENFVQEVESSKPQGWDEDDELLEKLNKQKEIIQKQEEKPKINYEQIDSNTLQVVCPNCQFKFKFDLEKNSPKSCPYCNLKISVK